MSNPYNVVNTGSNHLKQALDKLTTMESIALRQRHKIETIRFMLESKLSGSFRTKTFNCFIKELLEEINNE